MNPAGMKFVDLSHNSRMARLMELTRALRGCQSPYEALLMYTDYLKDAQPGRAHVVLSTVGLPAGSYRVWRFLSDDGTELVERRNPWENLDLPVYSGGIIAKIIENPTPHLVHDIDWSRDPHFAKLLGPYRTAIAIPLLNEGLPLNWSIALTRQPSNFTEQLLEESVMRAILMGSSLANLQISRELASANAQIGAEILRMAQIQRALLPEPIPTIPGLDLAASYETFGQVGGDVYDLVPLHREHHPWCIFIGDASGHGPAAAVVAAMVHAIVNDCADDSPNPADLFQTLNRRLCQKRIEGSFFTAFMGFYDPASRELRYVSAGHPPPLLLPSGSDRQTKPLNQTGGLPLGIEESASFAEAKINLRSGQSLLLYTDGIAEARAPNGNMFGMEGIERSMLGHGTDAKELIQQLHNSLSSHQNGRRPNDDQTALAIHVQ